ncbi:MAG: DUF1802 family protein [Actinomycetes bacterium]|uniref:Unannotated protein n=1 Tax=freshwater metagenome TaxID=449393 RepID=A0A6J7E0U2_9ZZZZ|nr:DUF1802 family protein [Actinomycetota bacterium]
MPISYKEWSVTVRALAEGEQLLTLRRGGAEELEHDRFFLYPTFDFHRVDLVRESHRPELERAMEEGVWTDGEPAPVEIAPEGHLPQPDRIRIRAWAEAVQQWTITDRRILNELSPFHVWAPDYAERRLGWRRRDPLHLVLLRTHRIPRPVTVRVNDEYATDSNWAQITRDLPFEGTPVLSEGEFDHAAEQIAKIVERSRDRTPALV